MPKLSLITINLNNATGLRKTIESVVNQKYQNYEYIIIDGGSDDGSLQVIKDFSNILAYWVSENDAGIYNAMNKGITHSIGEYLLFLNSGDYLSDNNVLSKIFEVPQTADILCGHMKIISDRHTSIRHASAEKDYSLSYFFTNSLCHPSTFIARRLFGESLYDETYKIAADKKFFAEKIVLKNCSIELIDCIISNFSLDGASARSDNSMLIIDENNRILSELLPARMAQDILLIKENFQDFRSLLKIKENRLLYSLFKILKKIATVLSTLKFKS